MLPDEHAVLNSPDVRFSRFVVAHLFKKEFSLKQILRLHVTYFEFCSQPWKLSVDLLLSLIKACSELCSRKLYGAAFCHTATVRLRQGMRHITTNLRKTQSEDGQHILSLSHCFFLHDTGHKNAKDGGLGS